MGVFTSTAVARCRPTDVFEALRDSGGHGSSSNGAGGTKGSGKSSGPVSHPLVPVPIEVHTRKGGGLRRGTAALVIASVAGHSLEFDVEILAANIRGLRIEASGPFDVELAATFRLIERTATEITGRMVTSGRPRSIPDRLVMHAGEGLLHGGALDLATHQLVSRAEARAQQRNRA
jgi:hypothetical protein